jgi:hypothetical protein
MHFDTTICWTIMCRYFLWQTQISSLAADATSLESFTEGRRPDLTLTYFLWTLPQTCPNRFYAVTIVYIYPSFPAHGALHTAVRFRAFVLFNLAFSSSTELSPVSTDHYFCCYVIWTHIWHCQIMLCVGRGSVDWLGIGRGRGEIDGVDNMQTASVEGKVWVIET